MTSYLALPLALLRSNPAMTSFPLPPILAATQTSAMYPLPRAYMSGDQQRSRRATHARMPMRCKFKRACHSAAKRRQRLRDAIGTAAFHRRSSPPPMSGVGSIIPAGLGEPARSTAATTRRRAFGLMVTPETRLPRQSQGPASFFLSIPQAKCSRIRIAAFSQQRCLLAF
ncbi:hypothetical protein FKP32DRAFT_986248 [Trametes sanguinea]|nr:hypothetical protein FKP32DRAFT_986248 [Trametes sanguinea]